MDGNKKADIRLLIVLIVTALIGFSHLLICGVFVGIFITSYIFVTVGGILMIWFAYSAAKWHNKRHAFLHERDGEGGEPSSWGIIRLKVSGWVLYLLGLFEAFLPLIIS